MFRRLSTGEAAGEGFLNLLRPNYWSAPDPRLSEAIDHVRSRRLDDGRWPLDWRPTGRVWFAVDDGQGEPSRWISRRALRVLRWWEDEH